MMADVSAIRGAARKKALIAADTTNRPQTKHTEEPIPERAMGVMEGGGATVRADSSVRKQGNTSAATMYPKFRFRAEFVLQIFAGFVFSPSQNGTK
jgi:hypothetical protein